MQASRTRAVFNARKKRRLRERIRSFQDAMPVLDAQEGDPDRVRKILLDALYECDLEEPQDLRAFSVESTRRGPRHTSCAADSDRHLAYLQKAREYLKRLEAADIAQVGYFRAALSRADAMYDLIRRGYLCKDIFELAQLQTNHQYLQQAYDAIRDGCVNLPDLPDAEKPEHFSPDKCSKCPIRDTDNSQLFEITMFGRDVQPMMCRDCLAAFLFGNGAMCQQVKKLVKLIHDNIEELGPKCCVVSVHRNSKHHLQLGNIEQSISRVAGHGQCDNPIKFRVKFENNALRPTSYYPSQLLLVDDRGDHYSLPSWYSELLVSGNKFWFGYTPSEAENAGFNEDLNVPGDKRHITHCDCVRQRIEYR